MNYPNAPIKEAIFDIRVESLTGIHSANDLQRISEHLLKDFPEERKSHSFSGQLQLEPGKEAKSQTVNHLNGFVYLTQDKTRQVQVRLDGFTMNVLKPYESWESHFERFLELWKIYDKEFGPVKINRIATRFINRISLPLPLDDFQTYISNMPPIPSCLPQTFTNFFLQVQVPCNDQLSHAIITETIEKPSKDSLPFILDIDVFQDQKLKNSDDFIEKSFAKLRNIKNEIFEDCITDKSRALFQ